MPSKESMKLVLSKNISDLKAVRIPGVAKSFEEMTIGELVNIRSTAAEDSYEVNAVTDNASITTSSLVNELGRLRAESIMKEQVIASKLKNIRTLKNISKPK